MVREGVSEGANSDKAFDAYEQLYNAKERGVSTAELQQMYEEVSAQLSTEQDKERLESRFQRWILGKTHDESVPIDDRDDQENGTSGELSPEERKSIKRAIRQSLTEKYGPHQQIDRTGDYIWYDEEKDSVYVVGEWDKEHEIRKGGIYTFARKGQPLIKMQWRGKDEGGWVDVATTDAPQQVTGKEPEPSSQGAQSDEPSVIETTSPGSGSGASADEIDESEEALLQRLLKMSPEERHAEKERMRQKIKESELLTQPPGAPLSPKPVTAGKEPLTFSGSGVPLIQRKKLDGDRTPSGKPPDVLPPLEPPKAPEPPPYGPEKKLEILHFNRVHAIPKRSGQLASNTRWGYDVVYRINGEEKTAHFTQDADDPNSRQYTGQQIYVEDLIRRKEGMPLTLLTSGNTPPTSRGEPIHPPKTGPAPKSPGPIRPEPGPRPLPNQIREFLSTTPFLRAFKMTLRGSRRNSKENLQQQKKNLPTLRR